MRKDGYTVDNIIDKANDTYTNSYSTATNFLDLNDQSQFEFKKKELPPVKYLALGGYDDAERKVIIFYPDYLEVEDVEMPFRVLKITSVGKGIKPLNHRDYLGAILNLGISRDRLGDIICLENEAYVILLSDIKEYVISNLTRVKHNEVHIEVVDHNALENYEPNFEVIKGTVSSLRIDSIVKLGFKLSRTKAVDLINSGRVFINSSVVMKPSGTVRVGDKISVRKLGKIKLSNVGEMTKKGRLYVEVQYYK